MSKLAGGGGGPAPIPPGYERVQTGSRVQYVGPRGYQKAAEIIGESEYERRLSESDAPAPARRAVTGVSGPPSRSRSSSGFAPSAYGGTREVDPRKRFEASWTRHEVPTWEIRPIATEASGSPGAPASAVASPAPPSGGPQPTSPGEPITPAKAVLPAPVVLGSAKKQGGPKPLGKGRTSGFFVKSAGGGLMADADDEKKKKQKLGS
jgi:hypothetical protein